MAIMAEANSMYLKDWFQPPPGTIQTVEHSDGLLCAVKMNQNPVLLEICRSIKVVDVIDLWCVSIFVLTEPHLTW